MPLYVDLHPAPQFDASLVAYCAVNFGRIRDILTGANKRIAFESWQTAGPWPAAIGVNVPFPADVNIWAEITYFSTVAGFIAMCLTWDGAPVGQYLEQYFNEAYSHKALVANYIIRGVLPGAHTLSQMAITGGVASDSNDRLRQHYTYYEI